MLTTAPSRRAVLKTGLLAGLSLAVAPVPTASAAPATTPLEYGYSFNQELFQIGFTSRADAALAAAQENPGEAYTTAEVMYHQVMFPTDLSEAAAESLVNHGHFGNVMTEWLIGSNEEYDFEGEFAEACNGRCRIELGNAGRTALSEALIRAGDPKAASDVLAGHHQQPDIDEAVLDTVAVDPILAAQLDQILRDWVAKHDLQKDMHGLLISGAQEHPAAQALAA